MRRWNVWYGTSDSSPEDVAEALGEALGAPFDRREEEPFGSFYVGERPDGETIKVMPSRYGADGARRHFPKYAELRTVVLVLDTPRLDEVRAAIRRVPGLEPLPGHDGTRPPLREDCYGWAGSQEAATEQLARVLALSFERREGTMLGRRWVAEDPGGRIEVRDNYLPHLRQAGEEPLPSEPRFPGYPRLVYATGRNPAWFDAVDPALEAIPNLVRLYSHVWGLPERGGAA